jgi:putative ABC transport system permease protein
MKLVSWFRTFLAFVFHRSQVEREMEDELRAHLESRADDLERQGLPRAEAERQARIEFGGYERYKEECREALGSRLLGELLADLRYGLRQLRRSPGFMAVAVVTLALGIGVNAAVFSVVRSVVLSPLPYSDPDRLVCIRQTLVEIPGLSDYLVVVPDYEHWRDQNHVFETLAAYGQLKEVDLSGNGDVERIDATNVTWDFFPMLGVRPALGRSFLAEEDRPGGPPVVVLSHSLWQRRFHSDPNLVGKTITLNKEGYTVIGIMPESFHFPADRSPELFIPTRLEPNLTLASLSYSAVFVIGRLKPDVKLDRARSDLVTINQRSDQALPPRYRGGPHAKVPVIIETLHDHLVGNVRPLLFILLGAVGFVLLLACANVANLQLARAATREKEFAVRTAIGAGRWRLARQLLVESLALAALGGVAGLILGAGGVALLRHFLPPNIPDLKTVRLDPGVFAFTAAITVLAGVVFGLAPIFVASRLDLEETLKEARPSATTGSAAQRLRSLLMVSEVALALVLLTGAGLLVGSFVRLSSVDPGFDPRHLLAQRVVFPLGKYQTPAQWVPFFRSVLDRVGGLPGVESVAAASAPPLTEAPWEGGVTIEGRPAPRGVMLPWVEMCAVSPNYFHTLRIPIISGREFTAYDDDSAPPVVIVNEAFARRFFGKENPVGRRILIGGPPPTPCTIIGVVRNTRHLPLTTEPSAGLYTSYLQEPADFMRLIVRSASDPASLASAVRARVQDVDRNQAVHDVATMEQRFSAAVAPQRFNALVMAIFAGMAVVLAAVGVYGVMAYSVARRTHEIGIRIALGAKHQDVMRLILGRGLSLVVFGITLGLAGALALTRLLSNLLYGITVRDPLTFVAVSLVLTVVALVASYIPARRATKVDPMVALRHE